MIRWGKNVKYIFSDGVFASWYGAVATGHLNELKNIKKELKTIKYELKNIKKELKTIQALSWMSKGEVWRGR